MQFVLVPITAFHMVIAGSDDVSYVVIVLLCILFRFRNLISLEPILLPFPSFSRRKLCVGSSRQYKSFFVFLKQTIQEFVNKTVYTNR
jgi:hypothetical protein